MVIAEGMDVKLCIFDIETLRGLFDVGIYDVDKKEWVEFEISKYRNDLYSFVSYYTKKHYDYWVSFNGINFDHQVLQYVVEKYHEWYDLGGLEICALIHDFVQKIIDDQRYDIQPPYKEYQFPVKCIDVFKIHHFDNEAKRTSLKWCAFMLNMSVEEMPIHHTTVDLSPEDIQTVKNYRKNDVEVTERVLQLTLGNIDLPELKDYKGKNKIQDRFDVQRETGMECLNWSDVKIGEEWNKLDYKNAENIKDDSLLFTKKVKHPFGQKFKNFFPRTMSFLTDTLKDFANTLGETFVTAKEQEFPVRFGKTDYMIKKGGIHSTEKNRMIIPPKGYILRDADVGSQYPNSIVKLNIYAPHLERTMMDLFNEKISRRITYKNKATELKLAGKVDEARPYSSVQEMLKLCLNGGYYGKLGQPGSFLEYPEGLLKVCIGNQIEILMLIEMMESVGFKVVSGNTDGIVTMFPSSQEDVYKRVCEEWEEKVGNTKMGKLEYTDFDGLWQDSINSYIAKKSDGTVKKKGRFMTEFELNKNKSKRVIALALDEYFINNTNPIDFITSHKNIFDFCIAKKAFGNLHYEELINDKEVIVHKKLIRYYVCNDGNIFKKRGINNEGNPMDNHCEAVDKDFFWMGQPKLRYFNKFVECDDYNINYSYYILETLKRIDKIEKTKKAKLYADEFKTIQTSLFS